jgi:hypothetical protein
MIDAALVKPPTFITVIVVHSFSSRRRPSSMRTRGFRWPLPPALSERLDEVSRVRLPESANPTIYGIDRWSWANDLSTDIVSC